MSERELSVFCWEPGEGVDFVAASVLSDTAKIRIDPADYRAKLALDADFSYPLDADISIRTAPISPERVDALEILEVVGSFPDGTSVGLRLFDGTDEYWYTGGAWTASPAAGEWNTEAEVNAALADYDVTASRTLAVVLNLVTTDEFVTPEISAVKLLWRGEFNWIESLFLDSLVRTMQEELKFSTALALPPLPSSSSSIDLDDYSDDANASLAISDVVGVYDYDVDPTRKTNLLSSYDANSRVATLSAAIPAGNRPYLRIEAGVEVAWDTHRDFEPIGRLPQVIVRNAETVNSSRYPLSFGGGIVRRATNAAVELPPAYRMTFRVEAEVRTDRNSREELSVPESLMEWIENGQAGESGPFLVHRAVDRRVRMRVTDEFRSAKNDVDDGDVATQLVEFLLENVTVRLNPAVDTYGVSNFKLGFAKVDESERQKAIANGAPIPRSPFEEFETN